MTLDSGTAAVELRGLTKRFGSVLANDGVNLCVAPGTIHGIVGENGAGKSTAMKILYGLFPPDAGAIAVRGERCVWRTPRDAIARGIGMVHQHFMLAGPCSVLDNILLGAEPRRFGTIDRRQARGRLRSLAQQYGLAVDLDHRVEELPVGIQQRVEILKLLFRDAQVLILDEPTSVLTPQETTALLSQLRRLRDEGKTIILITHKLNEVSAFTDRVTVFRAGKVTGDLPTSSTTPQALADLMVGRKVQLRLDVSRAQPRAEAALDVRGLTLEGAAGGRPRLSHVSLSVQQGEIVGIAGVEGNGQSELVQAILHPSDRACRTAGSVHVLSREVTHSSARRIRELGVAVIPEDRQHEGLLLELSVKENFLLGLHRAADFQRAGVLKVRSISTTASEALEDYDVRPRDLANTVGRLSGGNQQKLIIAREFQRQPRLLIAAQPTRGVDVGAIEFVHQRIVRARDRGAGVLLVSSDLDEVLSLSDRLLVMFQGRIVAEFRRGEVTEQELGLKMGGS